jgi:hypothetical protein
MKPGYVIQRGAPVLIDPDITTVTPEGAHDEKGKVVSWPAHMRLLEKNELAARRKQHLVAGTYASASTLGGIYQIIQDPDTDELSVVVSFGKRMASNPPTKFSLALSDRCLQGYLGTAGATQDTHKGLLLTFWYRRPVTSA